MKQIFLSMWLLSLISCSSLKRQKLYSGLIGSLIGGAIGAQLGKNLSPDNHSVKLNQTIGLGAGVSTGFVIGKYIGGSFWENDPQNMKKDHLFFKQKQIHEDLPKTQVNIIKPSNPEKIKIKSEIPEFLKGKVKEASIITYEIKDYQEEMEDGRIISHDTHKAYEYVLE